MASGALTDEQIWDLAKRMGLDIAFVDFKDDLMTHKLEYNRGYIINLSDQYDKHGKQNEGTHWTALIVRKYPNGKVAPMYFDPFGVQCPKDVANFVKKYTGYTEVPYNTRDLQSLADGICGYYVLAFLYYLTKYDGKTGELYHDADTFLNMFDDLNVSCDFKKNEFILKHFFRSANPKQRIPIDIENHITKDDPDSVNINLDTRFV